MPSRTKAFGFWRTWALVVGGTIGSGIFVLPALLAPYGLYGLSGWLIAGAGTLCIALSLGSAARRVPRSGGPYTYTHEAFGNFPGFLVAWGYWISLWSGVAALAVAFSGYLGVLVPSVAADPVRGAVAAGCAIWALTWVNLGGMKTASIVQMTTTLLKLAPLLLIAAVGPVMGTAGDFEPRNPDAQPLPLLFASVAMLTMWAYVGIELATVPADDVEEAERTIPRALVAGTMTAMLVYLLATAGVMALLPLEQLVSSTSPFADAAAVLFGPIGAELVAVGAMISILGAMNASVLASGQIPRAAARDGLLFAAIARANRHGAPAPALIGSAILSTVLIAMNFSAGLLAAFNTMILLSTLTTLVPYAASAASDLVLQRRGGSATNGARAVAIGVAALLFSIFAIVGSGWTVVSYGAMLLAAGVPVYLLFARTNAVMQPSSASADRPPR